MTRADANLVRETTGYAIGGVPPFGHVTRTRVLADRGLLDHDVVRIAAAGVMVVGIGLMLQAG